MSTYQDALQQYRASVSLLKKMKNKQQFKEEYMMQDDEYRMALLKTLILSCELYQKVLRYQGKVLLEKKGNWTVRERSAVKKFCKAMSKVSEKLETLETARLVAEFDALKV